MQSDTNEFVFKRKRKRVRIDAQDTDAVEFGDQVGDRLHSELIPDITVLSELAISSAAFPDNPIPLRPSPSPSPGPEACSESVVTVEKFLRSVQSAPRAKQTASFFSLRRPRAYIRRYPAERRTKPIKVPKRPRGSPRSRIMKTLFRAAVLAGGDPLDTLTDRDGAGISHTRRPLQFVPLNEFASPFESGETRAIKHSELDRGEDAALNARRTGDPSKLKVHHRHSSSPHLRVPLCLIPFREAEAAYSVMFP